MIQGAIMANIITERREWHEGLKRCGKYYEGFVDGPGEKVGECLENHQRDTASTFGTQSRRHVNSSQTVTENVSCIKK